MKRKTYWIVKTHIIKDDEYICSACGYKTNKPKKVCPSCGETVKIKEYDSNWIDEIEVFDMLFDDD